MKKCRICDGDFFEEPIIYLKNMPESAQGFLEYKSYNQTIDINLVQCKFCGAIQLDCPPVSYYRDVIRYSGFTSTMYNIRKKQFKEFIKKYNLENKKIIEIGCGNGDFLKILNEFNVNCFGIEHHRDAITINSNSCKVENIFLDREDILIGNSPFDAFVQFNFMEHQPEPNIMLKAIYNNLTENGVGLLTVPSYDYIFNNGTFYELIRDHLIYFSKETLYFLLNKNGFEILEYSLLNNDTHSVFVKKKEKLSGSKFQNVFKTLYNQIISYINSHKNTAIWGASHQGLTIASCYNLSNKINYIIDSAPFKQEKFSIGSNIEIISPEKAYNLDIDSIIIIAPGYSNEIVNLIEKNMPTNISISTILYNKLEVIK